MVRALVSEQPGPPESLVLGSLSVGGPSTGELRLRLEACGINYPDALMIEDKYQFPIKRPFAPGIEVCGIVEEVGEGVSNFAPGMRVLAQVSHGGLAEQVIARATASYRVPEGVGPEIAASFLLTYATAFHALRDRAGMKAGQKLLVLGAGGGVGLAAIDLGKVMGAHVVAGVSTEAKAEVARSAGADSVFLYPAQNADTRLLADQLRAEAPDGFDIVFDPVGGVYAEAAVRRLAWDGSYLVVGFAAGIPAPPLNLVLLKGSNIIGVFWGAFADKFPAAARETVSTLLDMLVAGSIRPLQPHLYPLEDGWKAIAALRNRQAVGKLVVTP